MIRDVFVYGAVGRQYGSHFRIDVSSPAEAVRALMMLRPGLRQALRAGHWRVVVGPPHIRNTLPLGALGMNVPNMPIHLVPSTGAAGGGDGKGIGGIIAGTVLIGAAIVATGGLGAAFAAPLIGGLTYGSLVTVGASMVLGGVAGLLTQSPQPQQGQESPTDSARPEDRPSFLFNGVTNNSQQGGPVPLVFGTHLVGSVVVSAALSAEDF
jgi:predicted phage tail protein